MRGGQGWLCAGRRYGDEARQRRLSAFPGRAHLTGVWPGALRARCVRDRVRAAEAHELCAAPQRLPQRSSLLAEAPLALPKTGQAQDPQRLRRIHNSGQAPEGPEAVFPRAEVEHKGAEPSAGTTLEAGLRESGRCHDNGERVRPGQSWS